MAYTTRFKLSPASIDALNCRVFAPILGAVQRHIVVVEINGLPEDTDFYLQPPWLELDRSKLGFDLEPSDKLSLHVEYFYKADAPYLFGFLTGHTADDHRTEIISKHYIDGHFSFDNGLYKEAVLNFGTVLEAVLNVNFTKANLVDLIKTESCAATNKDVRDHMHLIRKLRNKVHPREISKTADVGPHDAAQARLALQEIILFYTTQAPAYP